MLELNFSVFIILSFISLRNAVFPFVLLQGVQNSQYLRDLEWIIRLKMESVKFALVLYVE